MFFNFNHNYTVHSFKCFFHIGNTVSVVSETRDINDNRWVPPPSTHTPAHTHTPSGFFQTHTVMLSSSTGATVTAAARWMIQTDTTSCSRKPPPVNTTVNVVAVIVLVYITKPQRKLDARIRKRCYLAVHVFMLRYWINTTLRADFFRWQLEILQQKNNIIFAYKN